jgi:hypothetical protein
VSRGQAPSPACAIRKTQKIIDEALALWFPVPHSETGEDVAELPLHGGLKRDHGRTEKRIRSRRRSNSLIGPVVSR